MLPSWVSSWCYPANVRLDCKVIAMYKHSNLFGLIVYNEEKKFFNIETWLLVSDSELGSRIYQNDKFRRKNVL
jgi:hypothetical protein